MAATVIVVVFTMIPLNQARIDRPSLSHRREPVHFAGPEILTIGYRLCFGLTLRSKVSINHERILLPYSYNRQ